MGPIDKIVEKMKLLAGGKVRRTLHKEGLVDANGVATKKGRQLARRLSAEKYIDDNAEAIAKQLQDYAKIEKEEEEE